MAGSKPKQNSETDDKKHWGLEDRRNTHATSIILASMFGTLSARTQSGFFNVWCSTNRDPKKCHRNRGRMFSSVMLRRL